MKNTQIKAEVIWLTPSKAEELLKQNVNNRKVKLHTISSYVWQMKEGQWKENGEAIIIDEKGHIKDGQHRLISCIKANHSFWAVLVSNVQSDVMDTIDTGVNRTLSDVLMLNGYKNAAPCASIVKAIWSYKNGYNVLNALGSVSSNSKLSNSVGLEYMNKHSSQVQALFSFVASSYGKQTINVFNTTQLALYTYVLVGFNLENQYISDFIKELCGVVVKGNNAVSYVRKTVLKAKENKIGLNGHYVLGLVIRAWNSYVTGDPQVQYIRHSLDKGLPKVIRL